MNLFPRVRKWPPAFRHLKRSQRRMSHWARAAFGQARKWDRVAAVRDDFRGLTDESLESFRVLLTALATAPVEDPAAVRQ